MHHLNNAVLAAAKGAKHVEHHSALYYIGWTGVFIAAVAVLYGIFKLMEPRNKG